MWLITQQGFVSLVEHQDDPTMLRARARRKQHLIDTFDLRDDDIIDLGVNAPDYRWHADVPRQHVAAAVTDEIMNGIGYTSHVKEAVAGPDNQMYQAMLACWTAFNKLQNPDPADHDWWNSNSAYDEWEARNRTYVGETRLGQQAFRDVRDQLGDAPLTDADEPWVAIYDDDDAPPFAGSDADLTDLSNAIADRMLGSTIPAEMTDILDVHRWGADEGECVYCEHPFMTGDEYVDVYAITIGDAEGPCHVACAEDEGWSVIR